MNHLGSEASAKGLPRRRNRCYFTPGLTDTGELTENQTSLELVAFARHKATTNVKSPRLLDERGYGHFGHKDKKIVTVDDVFPPRGKV